MGFLVSLFHTFFGKRNRPRAGWLGGLAAAARYQSDTSPPDNATHFSLTRPHGHFDSTLSVSIPIKHALVA